MDTPVVIVLVIVLVIALLAAIGVAAWLYLQKRRSDGLRTSFGSEYDRAREEHPDRRSAERSSRSGRSASSSFTFGHCRPTSAISSSSVGARPKRSSSTTRRARRGWRTRSSARSCRRVATRSGTSSSGRRTSRWTTPVSSSITEPPTRSLYEPTVARLTRVIPRICGRPLSTIGRCSTTSSRSRRPQHRRHDDDRPTRAPAEHG